MDIISFLNAADIASHRAPNRADASRAVFCVSRKNERLLKAPDKSFTCFLSSAALIAANRARGNKIQHSRRIRRLDVILGLQ